MVQNLRTKHALQKQQRLFRAPYISYQVVRKMTNQPTNKESNKTLQQNDYEYTTKTTTAAKQTNKPTTKLKKDYYNLSIIIV